MELILIEKIKLSEKERKAFDTVQQCCHSVMRESKNTENYNIANALFAAIYDFYDMMEDDEIFEEEPTEEPCYDKRH